MSALPGEEPHIADAAPVPVDPVFPAAKAASVPDTPAPPKATASFKAALAAIRASWGKKSGAPVPPAAPAVVESAPAVVDIAPAVVDIAPAVVESAPAVADIAPAVVESAPAVVDIAPAVVDYVPAVVDYVPAIGESAPAMRESAPSAAEIGAGLEIDLTPLVEVIDDQPADAAPEPLPISEPQPAGSSLAAAERTEAVPEAADVYELSVDSDLQEFESQLFAPPAPAPRAPEAAPADEIATQDDERARARSPKRQRSKPAKRATKKTTQSKPRRRQPPQEPVQDEWGMFDPNQCGFAALVDKLDEVADKKAEDQPRTKVRVISYR